MDIHAILLFFLLGGVANFPRAVVVGVRSDAASPLKNATRCCLLRAKQAVAGNSPSVVELPLDQLLKDFPELAGLEPTTDQEQLPDLLNHVGQQVEHFFQNLPNTSSLEDIRQELLGRDGRVRHRRDVEFQYLFLTSPLQSGAAFEEYRTGPGGDSAAPGTLDAGYMLTSGFAATSLVFCPQYQSGSAFRFLGRQAFEGRTALVLAFAQIPEKSWISGVFADDMLNLPTYTQGLAWFDATTYEILRMRTDLLRPLPRVKLERESTDVRFEDVQFQKARARLRLPSEVRVTVQWRGRMLRNTHRYSEFRLFNVVAAGKGTRVR